MKMLKIGIPNKRKLRIRLCLSILFLLPFFLPYLFIDPFYPSYLAKYESNVLVTTGYITMGLSFWLSLIRSFNMVPIQILDSSIIIGNYNIKLDKIDEINVKVGKRIGEENWIMLKKPSSYSESSFTLFLKDGTKLKYIYLRLNKSSTHTDIIDFFRLNNIKVTC